MSRAVRTAVVVMALGAMSQLAAAQAPTASEAIGLSGARVVAGRVRRPVAVDGDSTGMGPAAHTWVTLHRVGKDSAGPVDSVRSDAGGRYRLTWRPFGARDAVYFAAVKWGGIAYFTAPLRSAVAQADEAEITVFDTTSRMFPLAIKGRHLIVGVPDSNQARTIIEVFELSNDSLHTLVASPTKPTVPTWRVTIPRAAEDVRITQGEVAPDAFTHETGTVSIFAPIAPGLKQVAFTYRLPAVSFPINIRAEQGAVVFEVLIEEERGVARGNGFTAVESVTIENRRFRRFLSQDVKKGGTVTLELPVTKAPGKGLYVAAVLAAVGFLALLVLTRVVQRRPNRAPNAAAVTTTRIPDAPLSARLAHEIAALDETFARITSPSGSVRVAYDARRAELKLALADALADALATADTAR